MSVPERLLVTGGAGFIGSNFVRRILARHVGLDVVVLDKLTYAGNLANLEEVADSPRFRFVRGDINDASLVNELAAEVDAIVNFAAESHVDRSILGSGAFIATQVNGTHVLVEAARQHRIPRFIQVSTDEVYGEINEGSATENSPLRPRSPYAASKAAADLLVLAYETTYGVPAIITRGSNTYGPHQYPEKLIPLFVTNAIDDEPLPLYGDGLQVRDWLHVDDHADAIALVLERGVAGSVYNIAAGAERTNLELTRRVLELLDRPRDLIRHVTDRPGHDRRYSIDATRLRELGWEPRWELEDGLAQTVGWFRDHQEWWRPLKSGDYLDYYRRQYGDRLAASATKVER
jgi:dTDP-glucose 4,6-dehydratase